MEHFVISDISEQELLDLLSKIISELKKREIMKTNDIVGELGEHYVIETLGLNPALKGHKDYDAEKDGIRYEIKARQRVKEPYRKKNSQYRLNGILKNYDFLILVFLDENFRIESMYKFPRKLFNKNEIPITNKLLNNPETERIR